MNMLSSLVCIKSLRIHGETNAARTVWRPVAHFGPSDTAFPPIKNEMPSLPVRSVAVLTHIILAEAAAAVAAAKWGYNDMGSIACGNPPHKYLLVVKIALVEWVSRKLRFDLGAPEFIYSQGSTGALDI